MQWLSYTYLFIRMKLNHVAYGIPYEALMDDMNLDRKRRELIDTAAKALDKARMIRYNIQTGDLNSTGNTQRNFYKRITLELESRHQFIFYRFGPYCQSLLLEVRHHRDFQ